jgi:NAD(P)H dehydrogenase (quinone)
MTTPLLVTGASGHLGRRAVELLLQHGAGPVIATTRQPDKLADLAARGVDVRRADFDDPASLTAAFAGARRALLISTDALGRRADQQRAAVQALAAAGVQHVVYTSLPEPDGSPISLAVEHVATEDALRASDMDHSILRNNVYADVMLGAFAGAIAGGALVLARGDGRCAYVTREDCAWAAAAALAEAGAGRRVLEVSGPAALSGDDLAALLTEIAGKPVAHVRVDIPTYVQGLQAHGVPAPYAQVLGEFEAAVAAGKLAKVTPTVERLSGHAPMAMGDFLRAHL